MAALPDQDRFNVWASFMRLGSVTVTLTSAVTGLTKAQLRAAVDATDDWFNANSAAYNAALPQPARGTMTTPQKAALLVYVIAQRYLSGV